MKTRKNRYFVGDFETTVYDGQKHTEVWASAIVELFTEDVQVFNSIDDIWTYLYNLKENAVCFFHNLKFDGEFWLYYFLVKLGFKNALKNPDDITRIDWQSPKEMKNNTIAYSISNMGQWYRLTVKVNDHIIEFRDSLKLLPFALKRIGQSFGTKHKKLDIEYTGFRYAGGEIKSEEKKYISNDVLVIKEALEIMFTEGHNKLTIGSCCLAEYRNIIGNKNFNEYFPNIYEIELKPGLNAGQWIKKSYRGGWCYVVKSKQNKVFHNGVVCDVNSLYPSVMSSESNSKYPIGKPTYWEGNYIPEEALDGSKYYFIHIRTRFEIKNKKLPFIQIKSSLLYKSTEMLTTSDIWDKRTNQYYRYYNTREGELQEAKVELTLTMTDWELVQEHYHLYDLEIIDGCYFNSAVGLFDEYIEKYKQIKLNSKGAQRELAKLFLNNLYGKMASSTNSSFKVAYLKEDRTLGYYIVTQDNKQPGYIPVGSAITSYARNFTIRAAQKNFYGGNKRGFIYSDTDSIHCDLSADELKGIKLHSKDFCCWKLEKEWDEGKFVRQKTYIEHIIKEDGEDVENPYYSITCAGMPTKCKSLVIRSMEGPPLQDEEELSAEEKEFLSTKRSINDFDVGLKVPGKLLPKRIPGGIVLTETTYEMR